MRFTTKELVSQTLWIMNMNKSSAPLIETDDIDALSVEEILYGNIEIAAHDILLVAPIRKLETGHNLDSDINWTGDKGVINLPEDFLRLITFKLVGWSRSADIIMEDEEKYQWQSSRFAGVRGNPQSPVVALCNYPSGLVLEIYSKEAGMDSHISRALYIPKPKIEQDETIDLPKDLKDAVCYAMAYKSLLTLGEITKASTFMSLAYQSADVVIPSNNNSNADTTNQ